MWFWVGRADYPKWPDSKRFDPPSVERIVEHSQTKRCGDRTDHEAQGGNDIAVDLKLRGALKCREGPCPMLNQRSNFRRV
jgi:hypothetical protein